MTGEALLRLAPAMLTSFGLQVSLLDCEQIIWSCPVKAVLACWPEAVTLAGEATVEVTCWGSGQVAESQAHPILRVPESTVQRAAQALPCLWPWS